MKRLALLLLVGACDAGSAGPPDAIGPGDCGCAPFRVNGTVEIMLTREPHAVCAFEVAASRSYTLRADDSDFSALPPITVVTGEVEEGFSSTSAEISLSDEWGELGLSLTFTEGGAVSGNATATVRQGDVVCYVGYTVDGRFDGDAE